MAWRAETAAEQPFSADGGRWGTPRSLASFLTVSVSAKAQSAGRLFHDRKERATDFPQSVRAAARRSHEWCRHGRPFAVAVGSLPAVATAECPTDSDLTGGGVELTGPAPDHLTSRPVDDTWQVSFLNKTPQTITATPYAVCTDNTP